MKLDLVDGRYGLGVSEQLSEMLYGEIAHSDRKGVSLLPQFLENSPASHSLAHRIVNQIKVDVIEFEPAQTLFERTCGISMLAIPELGRDKNLLARNPARPDGGADALLIVVERSGIDMPITGFQRRLYHCFTLFALGNLPDA